MLKKLVSLLFEEEEEVIEEELSVKEKPVKQERSFISNIIKEKPIKVERSLIASMNPNPIEEVRETVIIEEVIKNEIEDIKHEAVEDIIKPVKPEFGIAFNEPSLIKEKPKVIKEKPIYEFNPVISPMFGVSESKRSQPIRQVINPPQAVKRSRINTVISPIYGDVEKRKEESAKPTKLTLPVYKHDPFIEESKHDLPKFKSENYSLDDLLSPLKPQDEMPNVHESIRDEEDELAHQFNLFDDMK